LEDSISNGIYDFRKSIFPAKELNGFDPEIVFHCVKNEYDFTLWWWWFGVYWNYQNLTISSSSEWDVGNYVILNLARGFSRWYDEESDIWVRYVRPRVGIMTKHHNFPCGAYVDNAENLAYSSSSNDEA
jgi:hypothetical protein